MQSIKLFLQGFLPAFCCFSLMIMAAVLWVSPLSHTQEAHAQSYLSIPSDKETLTILAAHAEETLQSLTVLSLQPHKGQILIRSFPPDSVINGEKLSALWEQQDLPALKALLSAYTELEIQRQLVVDDRQLDALLERFCPISAVLEQPLRYTQTGLNVSLEPGFHRLSSQQCLYYIKSSPTTVIYARRSEELLQNAINEHWSAMASTEAQELFLSLLDFCDSDLNISDFDRCGEAFSFLAQMVEKPAKTQESAVS